MQPSPAVRNVAVTLCRLFALAALLSAFQISTDAFAQTLPPPPSPHVPVIDGDDVNLSTGQQYYKGLYHGYLYGHWNDGSNTMDTDHQNDGIAHINLVVPRCADGNADPLHCPSEVQKIVVVAMGFSNWTKEMCGDQPPLDIQVVNRFCSGNGWSFINKIAQPVFSPLINPPVVFVDCAIIGAVAKYWTTTMLFPGLPLGANVYENCDGILSSLFLSKNQVQVVLYKNADSGESNAPNPLPLTELPDSTQGFAGCAGYAYDPCVLQRYLATTARYIKSRYPYVQQMFLHSRIYGGYATTPLNPEPYAYEQAFAVKWLIQAQTDQMKGNLVSQNDLGSLIDGINGSGGTAPQVPWINWGAYLWASGTAIPCQGCPMPQHAGTAPLRWVQEILGPATCASGQECDFQANDNTHPSLCGRDKVSKMLTYAYCTNSYMQPWLLKPNVSCTPLQPPNTCTWPQ